MFLGTDLTDLLRFDYAQQLGVKQEIGRFGLLQGGILFSGIPAKVWKNPYVVDKNRDETSRSSYGGRLAWDRIFGSNFQLQLYAKIPNIKIRHRPSSATTAWPIFSMV